MAGIADFLLFTTDDDVVRQIQWLRHTLPDEIATEINDWTGQCLSQIPGAAWDPDHYLLHWNGIRFEYQSGDSPDGQRCILFRRENLREQLLATALDMIPDSIQIYDPDANIQYINRASKELVDLSMDTDLEGQHLTDVFTVDPDYSSTMTALRLRAPVRGRFDSYKSATGKELITVTSAQPILRDGTLLGCISVERDMRIIEQVLPEYQQIQRTLVRHLSDSINTTKGTRYTLRDLVGSDSRLVSAIELATRMAPRDNNILIQGETGTGKEIFAQGIHALSSRRNEKFVAVNCAAFPESLIEGMLFGTVKGAFTGSTDKAGLIEEANHGTLFLDELNSMSLGMQAKLLRVLQEGTLQRVGGTKYIPIDVRVISSCNENAVQLTEEGKLRKDLFYRLASIIVEIPPLRERMSDLEPLVWHYIHTHPELSPQAITKIDPSFWRQLRQHSWPGNVRELFHILNYALTVSENGTLRGSDFPAYFRAREGVLPPAAKSISHQEPISLQKGLTELMQAYEQQVLQEAYEACDRNATKAAELLKISRQNFQYYAKKYKLKD